jgi:hypothetical protein
MVRRRVARGEVQRQRLGGSTGHGEPFIVQQNRAVRAEHFEIVALFRSVAVCHEVAGELDGPPRPGMRPRACDRT